VPIRYASSAGVYRFVVGLGCKDRCIQRMLFDAGDRHPRRRSGAGREAMTQSAQCLGSRGDLRGAVASCSRRAASRVAG
jgi:hypothetical protein